MIKEHSRTKVTIKNIVLKQLGKVTKIIISFLTGRTICKTIIIDDDDNEGIAILYKSYCLFQYYFQKN